jgi:hypothetical protein
LRATRRRQRRPDPLASPQAVRSIIEKLRAALPDLLLRVAAQLSDLLERETSSHISFASFVDHHLRLLVFPPDVLAPHTALKDAPLSNFANLSEVII